MPLDPSAPSATAASASSLTSVTPKCCVMLEPCVCVFYLLMLKKKEEKKRTNRRVFLADLYFIVSFIRVLFRLSNVNLRNLVLRVSGRVLDALPRCPNSMHNRPRLPPPPPSLPPLSLPPCTRTFQSTLIMRRPLQPLLFVVMFLFLKVI